MDEHDHAAPTENMEANAHGGTIPDQTVPPIPPMLPAAANMIVDHGDAFLSGAADAGGGAADAGGGDGDLVAAGLMLEPDDLLYSLWSDDDFDVAAVTSAGNPNGADGDSDLLSYNALHLSGLGDMLAGNHGMPTNNPLAMPQPIEEPRPSVAPSDAPANPAPAAAVQPDSSAMDDAQIVSLYEVPTEGAEAPAVLNAYPFGALVVPPAEQLYNSMPRAKYPSMSATVIVFRLWENAKPDGFVIEIYKCEPQDNGANAQEAEANAILQSWIPELTSDTSLMETEIPGRGKTKPYKTCLAMHHKGYIFCKFVASIPFGVTYIGMRIRPRTDSPRAPEMAPIYTGPIRFRAKLRKEWLAEPPRARMVLERMRAHQTRLADAEAWFQTKEFPRGKPKNLVRISTGINDVKESIESGERHRVQHGPSDENSGSPLHDTLARRDRKARPSLVDSGHSSFSSSSSSSSSLTTAPPPSPSSLRARSSPRLRNADLLDAKPSSSRGGPSSARRRATRPTALDNIASPTASRSSLSPLSASSRPPSIDSKASVSVKHEPRATPRRRSQPDEPSSTPQNKSRKKRQRRESSSNSLPSFLSCRDRAFARPRVPCGDCAECLRSKVDQRNCASPPPQFAQAVVREFMPLMAPEHRSPRAILDALHRAFQPNTPNALHASPSHSTPGAIAAAAAAGVHRKSSRRAATQSRHM